MAFTNYVDNIWALFWSPKGQIKPKADCPAAYFLKKNQICNSFIAKHLFLGESRECCSIPICLQYYLTFTYPSLLLPKEFIYCKKGQFAYNWHFHYVTSHSAYYYHLIFCRFRKCKRKVPPPSLHSTDFEKSWFFSQFLVMIFFSKLTFLNSRWHFWNKND